jgi:glycosyltransferase 2 family protein
VRATYVRLVQRMLGLGIAAVAIVFFVQRIIANASALPRITWHAPAIGVAIATILLALACIFLGAAVWRVLLWDQGMVRPWRAVISLFTVSQFGKYLPGNVGQFVGRVVMGRRIGIPIPVTLATLVIEALWNVGTGIGVSALAVYLFLGGQATWLPGWLNLTALCALCVTLLAVPWIGLACVRRLPVGLFQRSPGLANVRPPRRRAALLVSALYLANYACMGAALCLQVRFFYAAAPVPWFEASGFCALAWMAGYLLPGAPAGIGVREATLLVLFGPLVGESTAVALGITLRLGGTVADALAFAVGWWMRPREGFADEAG